MKNIITNIKGTKDILPEQTPIWNYLESYISNFFIKYGYQKIIVPIFENTDLFQRSIGQETDIVSKEMYSWTDQGNNSLTLRPEFTASVARSYIQHQLGKQNQIHKLYYSGEAFRRERPQKGRYRQFRQFGIEVFGSKYPEQDAEIISIAYNLYQSLDITDLKLKINSIGSKESRGKYKIDLQNYLENYNDKLTETSQRRLQTNPLRILDTKVDFEIEILKEAPKILDYLNSKDKMHFDSVKNQLENLNIPFEIEHKLVRGLDYYSQTVFEIHNNSLGSQNALCGGGRYNYLIEELGGNSTSAIGFSAGFERLIMALDNSEFSYPIQIPDIYIISLGEKALVLAMRIAHQLRINNDLIVINDMLQRTLKSQMKDANRLNAKHVLIIGEDEIKQNIAQIKNMSSGEQKSIKIKDIAQYFNQS